MTFQEYFRLPSNQRMTCVALSKTLKGMGYQIEPASVSYWVRRGSPPKKWMAVVEQILNSNLLPAQQADRVVLLSCDSISQVAADV